MKSKSQWDFYTNNLHYDIKTTLLYYSTCQPIIVALHTSYHISFSFMISCSFVRLLFFSYVSSTFSLPKLSLFPPHHCIALHWFCFEYWESKNFANISYKGTIILSASLLYIVKHIQMFCLLDIVPILNSKIQF